MNIQPGQTLAHYRIGEKIGEGGMGAVYQATDTSLDREVAIKILPSQFSDDPERLARFEREAKLLASLNHTHIAAIHSFHREDDVHFLAMELVPGEDLACRLKRGPVSIDEAVAIARQVAEALEAAHRAGVVHRDLKPANINLTPDGDVKVLDFGLAKAFDPDPGSGSGAVSASMSPTLTAMGTAAGVIMGTAAYMSPEQARGRPVDRRADVWALGVVTFEMLTGRSLFHAETVSDTLASVLRSDPDWSALPTSTPPALRRLLRRCLEKDPKLRLHDAADARIELGHVFELEEDGDLPAQPARGLRAPLAVGIAAAALIAGALLGFLFTGRGTPEPARERVVSDLLAPDGISVHVREPSLALSPDGQHLAFIGVDSGGLTHLHVRDLVSGTTRQLPGTDGAASPFWSPDGREIGFHAGSRLLRVAVDSGEPQLVAEVPPGNGTWSSDGTLLFSADADGALLTVDAAGGDSRLLSLNLAAPRLEPTAPQFLPDGHRFLFKVEDLEGDASGVYTGELGSSETRLLLAGLTNAVFAEGYLFYMKDTNLLAQRMDTGTLELVGQPHPVAGPVLRHNYPYHGFFTVAASSGRLAYLASNDSIGNGEAVWVDRAGNELERTGIQGDLYNPRLAPGDRLLALDVSTPETHGDIWVFDLARKSSRRLTTDPIDESRPTWTPDASEILFFRKPNLYRIDAMGGEPREVYVNENDKFATDISPDGRWLLFTESIDGQRDLRLVDLDSGETRDYTRSDFLEQGARFSPDGKWVAYESDESGREEVYVDRFPERGERFRVSAAGGTRPTWRADGRELYYASGTNDLMAVPMDMGSDRNPIGRPVALFPTRLRRDYYEPSADGQRFLLIQLQVVELDSMVLVQNWQAGLAPD